MTDTISPERRSYVMSRVRSVNTKPELAVRSLLHSLGYRFRLHRRKLPGSPDIVFGRLKTAIFVHGCFWHRHGCADSRAPKSRVEFWQAKFDRNVERDQANLTALATMGWRAVVVWACELKDMEALRTRLVELLGPPPKAAKAAAELSYAFVPAGGELPMAAEPRADYDATPRE